MSSSWISTEDIIIRQTVTFTCMEIWTWKKKLNWLDQEYLSKFDYAPVDSKIRYQEPFDKVIEKRCHIP